MKFLILGWKYLFNPIYSPVDMLIVPIFVIAIFLNGAWWIITGAIIYTAISIYLTNKYFNSATIKEGD